MSGDYNYDKMDWKDLPSEPKAAVVLFAFVEELKASKKPASCSLLIGLSSLYSNRPLLKHSATTNQNGMLISPTKNKVFSFRTLGQD